ncbi:hypothetical protein RN001_012465 [Aquatica leii]|uniref:Transcription factor CBF/NF-Y/archaeal histone domain-containing protein n=1 Tax=Aquatica leii TaxID=1421715 RepID=A0AAN7SMG5_9COLE|nr:hypothetical protein RN001_012465 [Aquatica leii]
MDCSGSTETLNITHEESKENIDDESLSTNVKSSETPVEKKPKTQQKKFVRFPLSRVKHIMTLDPDCNNVSKDSVYLITKATELFLEFLGRESGKHSQQGKRKTVQRRDVDAVISEFPQLCFLEGALE